MYVFEGRSRCRDVFDIVEKIYVVLFVIFFVGFGEFDVIIFMMEGYVCLFKVKGLKFNVLALTLSDYVFRYDYFGVVLYDCIYCVICGMYVDVVYEIIDRCVFDYVKVRKLLFVLYKVVIMVMSLDGFKKIVFVRYDCVGRYMFWVGVLLMKMCGEI